MSRYNYKLEDMVILTDDARDPRQMPTRQNVSSKKVEAREKLEGLVRSLTSRFASTSGVVDPECYAVACPRCFSQRLVVLVSLVRFTSEERREGETKTSTDATFVFWCVASAAITVDTEDKLLISMGTRMMEMMRVSSRSPFRGRGKNTTRVRVKILFDPFSFATLRDFRFPLS